MAGDDFTLVGPGLDGGSVVSFEGKEALSEPYRFHVRLWLPADGSRTAYQDVFGKEVTLSIPASADVTRVVHGLVTSVVREGKSSHDRPVLTLRIEPRLVHLRLRRHSRIFQGMTALEIVEQVLTEHGVPVRFTVRRDYVTREVCVQHEETDLVFVTRLLAEEGLLFFFDQGDDGETMVVGDDVTHYLAVAGDEHFHYRPLHDGDSRGILEERDVTALVLRATLGHRRALLREYDFARPDLLRTAAATFDDTAQTDAAGLSPGDPGFAPAPATPTVLDDGEGGVDQALLTVYEHHGVHGEMQIAPTPPDVVLEQHRRRASRGKGTSASPRLASGLCFTLDDHDDPTLSRRYVVTGVRHTGHPSAGGGQRRYENRFHCAPAEVCVRPPRPPRRAHQVMETATVVGPGGQDIHTDAQGRIQVLFHWDTENVQEEDASCWIRVAQAWAGRGFGTSFLPRIGMEVLVGFLGGDIDRPVVMGCVGNATHPPPFLLPDQKTKSGFRTRSSPGAQGYNEISFEDAAGREQVHLHAERDLDVAVQNDHAESIGGERRVNVAGADALKVQGGSSVEITGDARAEVLGSETRVVYGSASAEVWGGRATHVEGDDTTTVMGTSMLRAFADLGLSVDGNASATIGTGDNGEAQIQVSGSLVAGASKSMRLIGMESLTLMCGPTTISVTPEGVTIDAPKIKLKASEGLEAEGPGPSMKLADTAEIAAKSIKLVAEKSRIELGEQATIKGDKIAMAKETPDPPKPPDAAAAASGGDFTVAFHDPTGEPYANKHYRFSLDGKIDEGSTDGDGQIKHAITDDSKVAYVRIWIEDYPTGATRDYVCDIVRDFPGADTVKGAKLRLQNLGYYRGDIDDDATTLTAAVTWFQQDRKEKGAPVEITGKVDGPTLDELKKAAGH